MLERSYMFAVLSIKTKRDRHERAFTAHYAGELSRKDAALETVYGGNKKNWIRRTFEDVNWRNLAAAVRSHYKHNRIETLLETVVDNLTGVSYRKASFMLAMLGLTEYACVDSNVARYADRDSESEFYTADSYMAVCDEIFADILGGQDRFIKQWAVYDMERGEHARHNAFFAEL
jgi:thermostable 8-oxoguanine DNA glycosylase